MINIIQGAQRYFTFGTPVNGYAQCSQIVVVIKDKNSPNKIVAMYAKVTTGLEGYGEVEAVPGSDINFRIFLTSVQSKALAGDYAVEIMRTIAGEKMPVYKNKIADFLTVEKTDIP